MMNCPSDYKRLCKLSWKERWELNKIVRRQKKYKNAYAILFNANNKTFVDLLSHAERSWLEGVVKQDLGDGDCLCCPCFAWEFDEDRKICGCLCTLGGKPDPDGKGECKWTNYTST